MEKEKVQIVQKSSFKEIYKIQKTKEYNNPKQSLASINIVYTQYQKQQNQSIVNVIDSQTERKNIPLFLFAVSNLTVLIIVFQEIPMFFQDNCDPKTYFSIGSLLGIIFVMIAISLFFVGIKEMFLYYFLLDTILVSWIASMLGFKGMLDVVQSRAPFFTTALKYLGPISSFCTTGTIRILIKHANFKKWQNIIFKTSIMANGMCYFNIGVYVMYTNHKLTKGMLPQMDSLSKDFCLLFVFGGLALFKQLINLHNRFDNTNKLNHDYKVGDQFYADQNYNQNKIFPQPQPFDKQKQKKASNAK